MQDQGTKDQRPHSEIFKMTTEMHQIKRTRERERERDKKKKGGIERNLITKRRKEKKRYRHESKLSLHSLSLSLFVSF
jgi:hypothetical protein